MWKEYEGNLQFTHQVLEALNNLNAEGFKPSEIKIVRFGEFSKIFYYKEDF